MHFPPVGYSRQTTAHRRDRHDVPLCPTWAPLCPTWATWSGSLASEAAVFGGGAGFAGSSAFGSAASVGGAGASGSRPSRLISIGFVDNVPGMIARADSDDCDWLHPTTSTASTAMGTMGRTSTASAYGV